MWLHLFTGFLAIVMLIRLYLIFTKSDEEKKVHFFHWLLQAAILTIAWTGFLYAFGLKGKSSNSKKAKTELRSKHSHSINFQSND
ncbi:hypothetical protein ACQ1Q5_00345 [Ornithobacterium rhinotracheale]